MGFVAYIANILEVRVEEIAEIAKFLAIEFWVMKSLLVWDEV